MKPHEILSAVVSIDYYFPQKDCEYISSHRLDSIKLSIILSEVEDGIITMGDVKCSITEECL